MEVLAICCVLFAAVRTFCSLIEALRHPFTELLDDETKFTAMRTALQGVIDTVQDKDFATELSVRKLWAARSHLFSCDMLMNDPEANTWKLFSRDGVFASVWATVNWLLLNKLSRCAGVIERAIKVEMMEQILRLKRSRYEFFFLLAFLRCDPL
jgi:hypothetical protein